MKYLDLSVEWKAFVMVMYFLTVILGLLVLALLRNRMKQKIDVISVLLVFVTGVDFLILTAFHTIARNLEKHLETSGYLFSIMNLSMIIFILPVICTIVLAWVLMKRKREYDLHHLSTASFKEAMDHLPEGFCLSTIDGRILFSNHMMNELCWSMTDESLQNAKLLWNRIGGNSDHAKVQVKEQVWNFHRALMQNENETIVKITASDVTYLEGLKHELSQKNRELRKQNLRLRRYGEHVDEVSKARERLVIKAKIHDEFGQILLQTRYLLSTDPSDMEMDEVLQQWKERVEVFENDQKPDLPENVWKELLHAMDTVGVKVDVNGNLPTDAKVFAMFTSISAEVMTNAIRHAHASIVHIQIEKELGEYRIRYTNDGEQPKEEVQFGTGLDTMRKRIEEVGGRMEVHSFPFFIIDISLPEGSDEWIKLMS